MNSNSNYKKILKLCLIGMFCALAFGLTFLKIPVLFLSLEIKDSVIVLCSLLFGPWVGLLIAVMVPLLELITHSTTGVYGLIMNILSSVTFAMVTGWIYRYKKSFYGAIVALLSGVAAVTAVMMAANLLITPYYMGVSVKDVAALIPKILLPFNLTKAMLNGAVVLLLYKPFSNIIKHIGSIGSDSKALPIRTKENSVRSVIVTIVAVIMIFISLVIIFFVLRK